MLTAERIQEMMQNAGLKPLEPMRVYILLIKFVQFVAQKDITVAEEDNVIKTVKFFMMVICGKKI